MRSVDSTEMAWCALLLGRQQVIDLQRHGSEEQHHEPVVDHGMHETGGTIAHERLHPEPGA